MSDAPDPVPPTGPAPPPRWKAIAVLAAVFVLGGAAGLTAGRVLAMREFGRMMQGPPGEARVHFRIETMRRHLDLTPDQVKKLEAIFEASDAERDRAMSACGPEMEKLRDRTDAKIREILTDDQKKRFEGIQKRRGPHRGPPHPPFDRPPPPPPPPDLP